MTDEIKETAKQAIELHVQVSRLTTELEQKKNKLRDFAAGNTLSLIVEGAGKVEVSKPREGSSSIVYSFNMEKVESNPELKALLMKKGIVVQETKIISGAKASVSIKPNV